jgi:hypothetical protein
VINIFLNPPLIGVILETLFFLGGAAIYSLIRLRMERFLGLAPKPYLVVLKTSIEWISMFSLLGFVFQLMAWNNLILVIFFLYAPLSGLLLLIVSSGWSFLRYWKGQVPNRLWFNLIIVSIFAVYISISNAPFWIQLNNPTVRSAQYNRFRNNCEVASIHGTHSGIYFRLKNGIYFRAYDASGPISPRFIDPQCGYIETGME